MDLACAVEMGSGCEEEVAKCVNDQRGALHSASVELEALKQSLQKRSECTPEVALL